VVSKALSDAVLEELFDYGYHTKNVDVIFKRGRLRRWIRRPSRGPMRATVWCASPTSSSPEGRRSPGRHSGTDHRLGCDLLHRHRRGRHPQPRASRRAGTADVIAGKLHAATLRARTGFAYVYLGYPMIDAFVEGRDPGHPIHALTAFLNSPELIAFGAAMTGEPA
jgi:hypothetical protein